MARVTYQKAGGATILGAGLALTGLVLQRRAARVLAVCSGPLSVALVWKLYQQQPTELIRRQLPN